MSEDREYLNQGCVNVTTLFLVLVALARLALHHAPFYDRAIAAANVERFRVPVVPGADRAHGAGPGEPGHLERLISAPPLGSWPLADRAADITR